VVWRRAPVLPQVCTHKVHLTFYVAQSFHSLVASGNTATLEVLASGTTKKSFTWKVDLPVGTEFNAAIKDSTGAQQFTAPLIVQEA
jgi:hypothetical protein